MNSLMRYINRISRCAALFRSGKLESDGINGYQHTYIINICRYPGISQEMLARTIYVNKSSVTRQLALLEQNGYIYRTPSEKDKRVMQVFPTQKAYDILPKVKCMLEEWEAYITSGFTDEEKSFMLSLLERMMEKAAERVERESDI